VNAVRSASATDGDAVVLQNAVGAGNLNLNLNLNLTEASISRISVPDLSRN
jgi:hypothetical protein